MSNNKNIIMIVAILIAGTAGFFASKHLYKTETKHNYKTFLTYPTHKAFTGFTLIDKNNKTIDQEYFKGKWTLLFFGYTNCPDVCPTTLTELQRAYKILAQNKLTSKPQVLFVSVDSERDSPSSLKDYIAFFNQDFNSATSDAGNIISLTSQIGVAFNIEEHETNEFNYTVDHTAAIFLVNPDAKLYGLFRSPHDANKIAADLTTLIGSK